MSDDSPQGSAPNGGGAPFEGFENTKSSHGAELGAIPFDKLIGGPLTAAIHGQVQSAMATVDFVRRIGFRPPKKEDVEDKMIDDEDENIAQLLGKPTVVTFEYEKTAASGMPLPVRLTIPFLTMLPIPSLRIEEVSIDFLAKITSMSSLATSSSMMSSTSQTDQASGYQEDDPYAWTALMQANVQLQRQTKSGASVSRDYSLGVRVKCVQDELPAGLGRLLDILEGAIKEQANESARHDQTVMRPIQPAV